MRACASAGSPAASASASIGEPLDLNYRYEHLGAGPETLQRIAEGAGDAAKVLDGAKNPMIVVGMGALARPDGAAVLAASRQVAERYGMVRDGWNGFNVLHRAAARVGGLDIGFVPGPGGRDVDGILDGAAKGEIDVVYLLGADEIDMARLGKPGEGAFVIYQGHHGDAGAHRADVILPGAAYTEKNGLYVNTEGRPQRGFRAVFPPGEAREDWKILRALSEALGRKLALRHPGSAARAPGRRSTRCSRRSTRSSPRAGRPSARPAGSTRRRSRARSPIST